MANNQLVDGDEIDFFDIIETLWNGWVTLTGFVVSAIAIGGVFIALNKSEYTTSASYEINPTPPFLAKEEIQADINRIFYDAKTFVRWKEGRPGTSLTVDMIDEKKIIDGADFGMSVEDRKFSLISASNGDYYIEIKSNDNQLIFEVLDYFEFVGLALSEKYVAEAKKQWIWLDKFEERSLSDFNRRNAFSEYKSIFDLESFLDKAAGGTQILLISRPLEPVKTNGSNGKILAIAIILGGTLGSVVLLVRQAYRARKLRLAEL